MPIFTNAASANISPDVVGNVTSGVAYTVTPHITTTYTLTANGTGGPLTRTVTVTVTELPPVSITSFTAIPENVTAGQTVTLTPVFTNATSASIDNSLGPVISGTGYTVTPAATTTYTLTANGTGGPVTRTVTVTVAPIPPVSITSFTATPSSITAGQTVTLTPVFTNATSVSIDNSVGPVISGTGYTVTPAATTTYTLTANGAGGPVTRTVTVTVDTAPSGISITPNDPNLVIQPGQSIQFMATVTGGSNQDVTWSLGGATLGSLSPTGFYTAPAGFVDTLGTVTVMATSVVDPSVQAVAPFQLVPTAAAAFSLPEKAMGNFAVAGETSTYNLGVFSLSSATSINSYSVIGPAGAAPTVDGTGLITWRPDLTQIGPQMLTLHVVADNGTAKDFPIPLEVLKLERVIAGSCGSEGGSFGDPGGNFMITIPPNAVAAGSSQVDVTVDRMVCQSGRILYRPNYTGLAEHVDLQGFRQREAYLESTVDPSGGTAFLAKAETAPATNTTRTVGMWEGYGYTKGSDQWFNYLNTAIAGRRGTDIGYDYFQDIMAQLLGEPIPIPLPTYVQPILFIHGYTPAYLNGIGLPTGGGWDTWGYSPDIAKTLATKAGLTPIIYEFKWKTAARFEDQAYNLGLALDKIKEETGQAPIVIAHSFGGVLCWTYLMNLAVNTDPTIMGPLLPSKPESIKQLITVNSPIGGIAWENRPIDFPYVYMGNHKSNIDGYEWTLGEGHARGDKAMYWGSHLTMTECGAPVLHDDGKDGLDTATDTQRHLLHLRNFYAEPVGSTVARIWKAAKDLKKNLPCPITTMVGIGNTYFGFDGAIGDGLISMVGQTFPDDLATVKASWNPSVLGHTIPGLYGNSYRMMSFTSPDFIGIFPIERHCGFLHTSKQRFNYHLFPPGNPMGANYHSVNIASPDGQITVGSKTFDHPLKTAMGDVIAEEAAHFQINVPKPTVSDVHIGPVTWDGMLPAANKVVYRLRANKIAANGTVTAHHFPQSSVEYGGVITATHSLTLDAGESATWELFINDVAQSLVAQHIEKPWIPNVPNVDLGAVHLGSLQGATVSFAATVTHASGAPFGGAEIRLWAGNISQATIQRVSLADTLVSRVLRTDANGTANATGLAPAPICTVLIQAPGYQPHYTTVSLAASGAFSFTLMPTAAGPFTQQGPKLVGTGAVGNARQGVSISISADGNTAIVGGPLDDGGVGAAWIWTRSGGIWTQQGDKLVGSGAVGNAQQGSSVSISADGNTAIVGGRNDNGDVGGAWVWTRSGGVWTQQGVKLVGSGAAMNAQQGSSVSISADGSTVIVGANADNGMNGAAWVWTRSGGVWTQQGSKLVGSGSTLTILSYTSVALSADGNTAIVGGPGDNNNIGTAWIWTRNGGTWTQQDAKLASSYGFRQGQSVSLSHDGNTAVIGAYNNGGGSTAYVWTRNGGMWTQQGAGLTGLVGLLYDQPVCISGGGTIIATGDGRDGLTGSVTIWTINGGVWTQLGTKLIGLGAIGGAGQGASLSVSAEGNTIIIGGPGDNQDQGAAWVFTR